MGGNYEMPGTDGQLGRISAYEARTLKPVWSFQQKTPFLTGVMTTAGGLGFVGDWDPQLPRLRREDRQDLVAGAARHHGAGLSHDIHRRWRTIYRGADRLYGGSPEQRRPAC